MELKKNTIYVYDYLDSSRTTNTFFEIKDHLTKTTYTINILDCETKNVYSTPTDSETITKPIIGKIRCEIKIRKNRCKNEHNVFNILVDNKSTDRIFVSEYDPSRKYVNVRYY